jgi:drug/metabolite transporter (DMT)-like permease
VRCHENQVQAQAAPFFSILLAALGKLNAAREGEPPVWLEVLGAVMVVGGFAVVLTYSTDVLSSRAPLNGARQVPHLRTRA